MVKEGKFSTLGGATMEEKELEDGVRVEAPNKVTWETKEWNEELSEQMKGCLVEENW